jgi:hypothetical protein
MVDASTHEAMLSDFKPIGECERSGCSERSPLVPEPTGMVGCGVPMVCAPGFGCGENANGDLV